MRWRLDDCTSALLEPGIRGEDGLEYALVTAGTMGRSIAPWQAASWTCGEWVAYPPVINQAPTARA